MRQGHLDSRSRWPASSLRPTGGLIQLNRLATVAVVRLPPLSSTSFHGGSSWSPGGWLPCLRSGVHSLLSSLAYRESTQDVAYRAGSGFGEGQPTGIRSALCTVGARFPGHRAACAARSGLYSNSPVLALRPPSGSDNAQYADYFLFLDATSIAARRK